MDDKLDELIEGEGFSDEERKEIRDRAAPPEPAPTAEEPVPAEPGERDDPARETKPDEADEVEEPEKPQKPELVRRIDSEKAKRKAAEKELADMRAKWEQTEKRIAELTAPPAPPPEKPAIPDPNEDAFGHLQARIAAAETLLEQQRRQAAEAEQQQSLFRRWNSELHEYKEKTKPDILDSINFLKDIRVRQMSFLGAKPDQIEQALSAEEAMIVNTAHQSGKNPAELFYELASMVGYRAPEVTPKQDDATDDLKRISSGQKKAASSVTSGGADIRGLTLQKILDMPQQEYEDLVMEKFGGSYDRMLAKLQQ